jgi:Flp pilus assembly protein TadG
MINRLRTALRAHLPASWRDTRANVMFEFAIVGPIFFVLLFTVFEVSYDLYLNEVLDTAVQATARQIQLGEAMYQPGSTTAPNTEQTLVNDYLCPNALGFLNCNNLYLRVERIDTSSTSTCAAGQSYNSTTQQYTGVADLYDATGGQEPIVNGALELGLYGGTGGNAGPTFCETASSASGFCVAGPSAGEPELIVLSAVYVAPSFLGRLTSKTETYNGNVVRATFSSAAFITEGFSSTYTQSSQTQPNAC